jgi:hypothetical protein
MEASDLNNWMKVIDKISVGKGIEEEEQVETFLRILDGGSADSDYEVYKKIWALAEYEFQVQKSLVNSKKLKPDLRDMPASYIYKQIIKGWNNYAIYSFAHNILDRKEVILPDPDMNLIEIKAYDDNPKNCYLSRIFVHNPIKNQWIIWHYNWESRGCGEGHYYNSEIQATEEWDRLSY